MNANAAENISVLVRFRPINQVEHEQTDVASPITFPPGQGSVECKDETAHRDLTFHYDRVFAPGEEQETVYQRVGPKILDAILSGINAAIIAYGQTGSGKTYTMFGAGSGGPQAGVVPRLLGQLFDQVANPGINKTLTAQVSFIQIYRENIMDLLSPGIEHCLIREDRKHGLWVTDATALQVATAEDALQIMAVGERRRIVAATKANAHSSRSHTVFIVSLTTHYTFDNSETFSQLYLVDLAGSECVEKTGSEGERLNEAKCINTSLLALRNVIRALVTGKSHVPYRDSKITRLLQNSFGGNAKTCLIVCCSPAKYNYQETLSSLRFGVASSQIQNRPVQNVQRSVEELTRLLQRTSIAVAHARARLRELELAVQELEAGGDAEPDLNFLDRVPAQFLCPLTKKPMTSPVVAMDGRTYDEVALCAYLAEHGHPPGSAVADRRYLPNVSLREEYLAYRRLVASLTS